MEADREPLLAPSLALGLTLAAAALAASFAWRPPVERGPFPDSARRALATIERLARAPRPGGTAAHDAARAHLVAAARALGLETEVQETLAVGPSGRTARVRNVLARSRPGPDAILLIAAYDSVGCSPGAADGAAGPAVMLELAHQDVRPDRPLILCFADAGQAGLAGVEAFCARHPWAEDVAVAVAFDARGGEGPALPFETGAPSSAVDRALARARRTFATTATETWFKNVPTETVLAPLRARGVPGVGWAWLGGARAHHTPLDAPGAVGERSVRHMVACAVELLGALEEVQADGSARRPLLVVPGLLGVGGSVLAWRLAAALALLVLLVRSGRPSLAAALRLGLVASAPAAVAVAWRVAVERGLGASPDDAPTLAWAALAACGAGASLALAARRGGDGHPPGDGAPARTAWLGVGSMALALALALPGLAPLAVAPAVAAAGATLLPRRWTAARALLPALVAALAWAPVAAVQALSFGLARPELALAPLGALLALLAPTLEPGGRALCRGGLALTTLGGLALAGATLAIGPTPSRPAPLNTRYIVDAEHGRARWETSTFGRPLPDGLERLGMQPTSSPPFPWLSLDRSLFAVDVEPWDEPPPVLELRGAETDGEVARWRLAMRSPRGAPRLHLHLEGEARLVSSSWNGHVAGPYRHAPGHLFFAVPPEGFEVVVEGPPGPLEAWLLDQDWALPADGARWTAARGPTRVPRSDGDIAVVGARFLFDAPR